jgi:hypothetical protein
MYIVVMYSSDMDVYTVLVCIGVGILSIIGRVSGICSVICYMLLWPFIRVYVSWMEKIISAVKLNESIKKLFVLFLVMSNSILVGLFSLYIFGMLHSLGFISFVVVGVYVFVMISIGIWVVLLSYVILSLFVNINYKYIILGVMPLPSFFAKVCANWVLLYVVMLLSLLTFL